MLSALGPNGPYYLAAAAGLVLAGLIVSRIPVLGTIVRLALTVAMGAVLIALLAERAPLDPYLSHIASLLKLEDQQVSGGEMKIPMGRDGHFWVRVRIDGIERRMLVDSGATITAISAETATAADLPLHDDLFPILLRTANGTIKARSATVGDLRLGTISARKLAVVVSPAFGDTDVLGMNFLSRLKSWRVEGRTLVLVPHHPQPLPADGSKAAE